MKQHKSYKNKAGTQNYTYAGKCSAWQGRQPIAVTKDELDRFKDGPEGEGVSYHEAVSIDNRDPNIYYMCPQYWDVDENRPRAPNEIEEVDKDGNLLGTPKAIYKDNIINSDLKLTAKQKKNVDRHILKRDEAGYWNSASKEPDIKKRLPRFKLELWENFHPEGYKVPCCRAPAKSEVVFKHNDEVEVLNKDKTNWDKGKIVSISTKYGSTFKWKPAQISTSFLPKKNPIPPPDAKDKIVYINKYLKEHPPDKEKIFVIDYSWETKDTDIKQFDNTKNNSSIRMSNKGIDTYISNGFPCNLGTFGHVDKIIKKLVHQNFQYPDEDKHKIGLVRKGIKRGSEIGDHSFLNSIQTILSYNNSSVTKLRENIMDDLIKHPNILSIGGGSFINTFKLDINDVDETISKLFLDKLKKDSPKLVKNVKPKESDMESFIKITSKGFMASRLRVINEFKKFSAINQFKEYIYNEKEIIVDPYIIPILISISKFPSKTFGSVIKDLSIIVFDKNNEDVSISEPSGGFPEKCDQMILLYKESDHKYEPILYKKFKDDVKYEGPFGYYIPIIKTFPKNDKRVLHEELERMHVKDPKKDIWWDPELNDTMLNIIHCIQEKVNDYIYSKIIKDTIMNLGELTNLLRFLEDKYNKKYPIHKYVYDNYYKITHVVTDKNILIPVSPSPIITDKPLIYISNIDPKVYPSYSDVKDMLELLDKHSRYKKYLDNAGISVVGREMVLNELIINTGQYIPLKKDKYNNSIHKLDVVSLNSYKQIDTFMCIGDKSIDSMKQYSTVNDYKQVLTELFFQKTYFKLKEDDVLSSKIRKIINHPIKLRIHKAEDIYDLLSKVDLSVILKDEDFNSELYNEGKLIHEEKNKLIIRNIEDEVTTESNDIIYYKLLKSFIELLIIYDESEYDRFLQIDISFTKIKQLLHKNELLFTYSDIENEYYLDYFDRYSKYIHNISLYGEGIDDKKMLQLNKQKDKSKKELLFVKQYPRIIHTLFGRKLTLLKHRNSILPEIQLISDILSDIVDVMNIEIIQSLLDTEADHKLNEADLDILANEYGIGFCLVSTLLTKRLEHDVIIQLPRDKLHEDIQMVLLYQYENTLIHIQIKEEDTVLLSKLKTTLFMKHLKSTISI